MTSRNCVSQAPFELACHPSLEGTFSSLLSCWVLSTHANTTKQKCSIDTKHIHSSRVKAEFHDLNTDFCHPYHEKEEEKI